jgi:hypothetical protein
VSGTGTAVGTGKGNTQLIVESLEQIGKAAQRCDSLSLKGYDDWFLPSKDELNLMYRNLHRGAGEFSHSWYWSSSQHSNSYSWVQNFSGRSVKNPTYLVRCVQAF